MPGMNTPLPRPPPGHLLAGQFQHVLLLACLAPGALFLAAPALDGTTWLGVADRAWFGSLVVVVVVHQVLGWFVFRTQLVWSLFSRLFGRFDLVVWGVLFFPLLAARLVLTIGLAVADAGSLGGTRGVQVGVAVLLLVPVGYTLWSVHRYFGVTRALGGDHFRGTYRELGLVAQGAFRWTPHAMYTFAFLVFWSIALLGGSRAALAAALFQHAYIWVHLYCTERPDMEVIYGR